MVGGYDVMGYLLFSLFILSSFVDAVATPCTSSLRIKILDRLGRAKDSVIHELKRQAWNSSAYLNSKQQKHLNGVLSGTGIPTTRENRWNDVVNHIYLHLRKKEGLGLHSSETMANILIQLKKDSIINESIDLKVETMFALGILRLESFQKSDYSESTDWILSKKNKGLTIINFGNFFEYTESYIYKSEKYTRIKKEPVIFTASEFRSIVSSNHWPVTLKDHDIRHIHYGMSHPKALGLIFTAARSKNEKRFFLISSLFEGVDTVQYHHEMEVTKYFRELGMGLEEAIIHVSSANQARLNEIIESAGYKTQVKANYLIPFTPKYGGNVIKDLGKNNRRFDKEVDQFLNEQHDLLFENTYNERPDSPSPYYYERLPHSSSPQQNYGPDFIWSTYL